MSAADLKTILMYVLPVAKCTDRPSRYTSKEQYIRRLEKLPNPWYRYVTNEEEEDAAYDEKQVGQVTMI